MASRVHHALQQAATEPRPIESYAAQTWDLAEKALRQDKDLGWNLLDMPNRLRIQTIDSFLPLYSPSIFLRDKAW